jgi:hypothetical protein
MVLASDVVDGAEPSTVRPNCLLPFPAARIVIDDQPFQSGW